MQRIGWGHMVRVSAIALLGSSALVCSGQQITMPPPQPKPQAQAYEQSPWMLVVGGGWSRRLATLSDTLPQDWRNFHQDQRSGTHLSLGIEHWRSNSFGYGLQGDLTRWSNSSGGLSVPDGNGGTDLVPVSSNIRVIGIGPQVMWRPIDPRGKTAFTVVLAGGYVGYRDAYTVSGTNYTIVGRNLFGSGALVLDHKISRQVTLGLRVGYVLALINSFEVEQQDGTVIALPSGYTEDVKRLDIGLRLGFSLSNGRLHSDQ
jgi:hypothetical protein